MDWDAIVQRPKTKYRSIDYQNLWISKAQNAKASSNKLAGLHAKVNKLTYQVRAQDIGGAGRRFWTCGGDHVKSDCPRKADGGTTSCKFTPLGSGENRTRTVERVS